MRCFVDANALIEARTARGDSTISSRRLRRHLRCLPAAGVMMTISLLVEWRHAPQFRQTHSRAARKFQPATVAEALDCPARFVYRADGFRATLNAAYAKRRRSNIDMSKAVSPA
jgi:hypothetical protein